MTDLSALLAVAQAREGAAEARLAALRREEAALRGRLLALDAARRDRAARALAPDPALRAGADLRWDGWVAGRAAELNAALARLLAAIERARAELGRELGRRAAVEALRDRETADRRRRRLRLEDRAAESAAQTRRD